MELITKDGMVYLHKDSISELTKLKDTALKVRLSIISYNKSNNPNSLNACCRKCNEIVKLVDKLFS